MKYFDWTATSPMTEIALSSYCDAARNFIGNPSSVHNEGLKAKEVLENSRRRIAELLKTDAGNIYFTSGGTEADNIVIQSLLNNLTPGEIICSAMEHSAVLENKAILEKNGWTFTLLKCPEGYVDLNSLKEKLSARTKMVCIMAVNNVTGTIQDIKGIVDTVREYEKTNSRKIHIHCDAVQALGKIEFYPQLYDLDSAAFSSHKIGGPKGIGILYNRSKSVLPLSKAGGQEKGLRGGTENLSAIVSMTDALEESLSNLKANYSKVLEFRKIVEKKALEDGYSLISPSSDSGKAFSPYILTISVKPLPSEVYLRIMSDKGFCLSAGSACSTNSKGKAESVLTSMNVKPEDRSSAIRISFGSRNTMEEVLSLAGELK